MDAYIEPAYNRQPLLILEWTDDDGTHNLWTAADGTPDAFHLESFGPFYGGYVGSVRA